VFIALRSPSTATTTWMRCSPWPRPSFGSRVPFRRGN